MKTKVRRTRPSGVLTLKDRLSRLTFLDAVQLEAGDNPLDLMIYKTDGWVPPCLGLAVESANLRPTPLHNFASTLSGAPGDPIYLDAKEPQVFRSFMDFTKGKFRKRIVHAVGIRISRKIPDKCI